MPRAPFYIIELSPWPLIISISTLFFMLGLIDLLHSSNLFLMLTRLALIIACLVQWWRDIIREATIIGKHTFQVQQGLRIGITLFIIREICFFLSFFWAYFHRRLAPSPELGCIWPPIGLYSIDPISIPLLNTAILLGSGFTVTLRHHNIILKKRSTAIISLLITILLGTYFTSMQIIEYMSARFTIADRAYGSIFFVATGFHGLHVIIGTLFLFIALVRIIKSHFSPIHHFGFDAAAWYWHFVDVVWICLYICIYWWGA